MNTLQTPLWRRAAAAVTAQAVMAFAHLVTGLHSRGHPREAALTVYYGNHTSHGDFVLIWTALPRAERRRTRPVAGEDYWDCSALRRFIGHDVFRALMIRRGGHADGAPDPVQQMADVLRAGDSLILFPEGTRNLSDAALLPFKSGLYHLAGQCPEARLVPVWIDNIWRVLPKGTLLPVPLACNVRFGVPMHLLPDEGKKAFLARARDALLALRPEDDARPVAGSTATADTHQPQDTPA